MIDPDFLEIFRDEATGRLDSMTATLLELEAGRGDDDALDVLFREVHSLKGGAEMVELHELGKIAHAAEDLLHDARAAGSATPELVKPLLASADAMRSLLERASSVEPVQELAHPPEPEQRRAALAVLEPAKKVPDERASRGIRIAAEKIDRLLDLVGESMLHRRRLEYVAGESRDGSSELRDELDHGNRLLEELKDAAVGMRTLPVSAIVGALPRAVRDAAVTAGKSAELTVHGGDTELDRVILEGLADPFAHLIRNAVAHGIETPEERLLAGKHAVGRVELRAAQHGGWVEIIVADDGRGVARSVFDQAKERGVSITDVLTQPGFSTADEVTELAGRGVGLDAVRAHVESFGGTLEVTSSDGQGTEIAFVLPLALALLEVLLVERGGNVYGIPLAHVEEVIAGTGSLRLGGERRLEVRGQTLSLRDLADCLTADAASIREDAPVMIIQASARRAAIACDALLGEEEVVVKPLGPLLRGIPGYLGASILGDGRIALLVEPAFLVRFPWVAPVPPDLVAVEQRETTPKVLVVEDSVTVRELQRSILEAAGYRVVTARDGREGLKQLLEDDEIDLVLTDVEMPHMSGFELTEAIRASPEHSETPVVILTSLVDDSFRARGLEAGADAYMVKSHFGQTALLETVGRFVG